MQIPARQCSSYTRPEGNLSFGNLLFHRSHTREMSLVLGKNYRTNHSVDYLANY